MREKRENNQLHKEVINRIFVSVCIFNEMDSDGLSTVLVYSFASISVISCSLSVILLTILYKRASSYLELQMQPRLKRQANEYTPQVPPRNNEAGTSCTYADYALYLKKQEEPLQTSNAYDKMKFNDYVLETPMRQSTRSKK